jgi:hypothetical protein
MSHPPELQVNMLFIMVFSICDFSSRRLQELSFRPNGLPVNRLYG